MKKLIYRLYLRAIFCAERYNVYAGGRPYRWYDRLAYKVVLAVRAAEVDYKAFEEVTPCG